MEKEKTVEPRISRMDTNEEEEVEPAPKLILSYSCALVRFVGNVLAYPDLR